MSTRSVHLPPRHSLPRDVVVPELPGLGTTWYDRCGGTYWMRRAGMSLMWLIATALMTLITVAVLIALKHRSTAGFTIVLAILAAYSVGILAYIAAGTVRHWNDPEPPSQLLRRRRGAKATGAGKGGRIRPAYVATQVFFAFSFLTIGMYLGLLLTSLLPETLAERRVRLLVAGQLRRYGHVAGEA